jgi:raffinose/stachyose/melibiose transport system substrate-binding protein
MAQKVQLLAGQDALTSIYQASQSHVNPGGDFYNAGQVLDVGKALDDLGVRDDVTPAAESAMKQIFDNTVPTIPLQFNVEGLFYNKKIFKQLGLTEPKTYDELLSDASKIKASGTTPFSASGVTGYTISRWIGIYLYRELGPSALQDIKDGKAKLTDPKYVKAAQALQDMGKKGYFPEGVTNLDQSGAYSLLLNGKAAMMYGLSNFLFNVNDPAQDKVGADNIGFMPFPAVKGGKGTIDQYPANVGSPNEMNPKLYGPKEAAWLKCIATNYGSSLLKDQGAISGFKVNTPVKNVPAATKDIQTKVAGIKETVLWFEALMGQKATSDAQYNAAPLLTGAMSAKDYMALIQADQSAP